MEFLAGGALPRRPQEGVASRLPRPPRPESEASGASDLDPLGHHGAPVPRRKFASTSGALPYAQSDVGSSIQQHGEPAAVHAWGEDGTARSRPRRRSPQHERSRQELLDAVMRERVRCRPQLRACAWSSQGAMMSL